MLDWKTYISGRGSVLEIIKAGIEIPPGSILFEDPPTHDLHRGLLSRVFTPKKMQALEPQVRAYCAEVLDPLVGTGGVRLRRRPGQVHAHAGHRHAARHPRGGPGGDPRAASTTGLRLEEGVPNETEYDALRSASGVLRLHHLARRAPLRRPDDRAAQRRVRGRARDDAHADPRGDPRLRRPAVRGRERDHDPPDRLRRRGARAATPTSAPSWSADRSLVNNAIEELLRYESPSPVQSRYVARDVESTARRCPRAASWCC